MTAVALSPTPIQKFFDNNGRPLSFGTINTYQAGTTTPVATYIDSTGTTPNTNPITLNARGEANIWLIQGQSYKYLIKDVFGFTIATIDGISNLVGSTNIFYAQTAAELAASVTPTNYFVPSHDVEGFVYPQRYGWSSAASGTTNYSALVNANLVAGQSGGTMVCGPGTYAYKPSAELILLANFIGVSPEKTIINCDTSSYTGRFFRCCDTGEIRDMQIKTNGTTKQGIGVTIAQASLPAFSGHFRLTRVWVLGFDKNIDIGNVFTCTFDQVRYQNGNEGIYCVPDSSSGNGYVTTLLFLNCYGDGNGRNIHFAPAINSIDVSFIGGAPAENHTGGTAGADFSGINTLSLRDIYIEANSNTGTNCYNISSASYLFIDGITYGQPAGPFVIGNVTTRANVKNVVSNGATTVWTVGATNNLIMENCALPSSGNTFPANTVFINSIVNGTSYIGVFAKELASYNRTRFQSQVTSVSGAGATDVFRFLDITGTLMNVFVAGTYYVKATDHSTGANAATYILDILGNADGTGGQLTASRRLVTGTDPGVSATPFTSVADGGGGAMKLQFQKNGAITQVDLVVVFCGNTG